MPAAGEPFNLSVCSSDRAVCMSKMSLFMKILLSTRNPIYVGLLASLSVCEAPNAMPTINHACMHKHKSKIATTTAISLCCWTPLINKPCSATPLS